MMRFSIATLRDIVLLSITMVVVHSSYAPGEPGFDERAQRGERMYYTDPYEQQGELSLTEQGEPSRVSSQDPEPGRTQIQDQSSFVKDFYNTTAVSGDREGECNNQVDLKVDSPSFPIPSAPPAEGEEQEAELRKKPSSFPKPTLRPRTQPSWPLPTGGARAQAHENTCGQTHDLGTPKVCDEGLIHLTGWRNASLKIETDLPSICQTGGCCDGDGVCGTQGFSAKLCCATSQALCAGACCLCCCCYGLPGCHKCGDEENCVPCPTAKEWSDIPCACTGTCGPYSECRSTGCNANAARKDKGSICCPTDSSSKIDTKHARISIDVKQRALVIDLKRQGTAGVCFPKTIEEPGSRYGWAMKTACNWGMSFLTCCTPCNNYVQKDSGLYEKWIIPFKGKGRNKVTYEKSQMRDGTWANSDCDPDRCDCCCCFNPIFKGLCSVNPRNYHTLKFNVEAEGFLRDPYYAHKNMTLTLTEKYRCCGKNREFWETFDRMVEECETEETCGCGDILGCCGPMAECLKLVECALVCCVPC